MSILPPYETQTGGAWYAGTADAITQNLDYIKANDPKYVLILSGDHLYRMDYRKMLKTHIENNADLTVSVMPVPVGGGQPLWHPDHRPPRTAASPSSPRSPRSPIRISRPWASTSSRPTS